MSSKKRKRQSRDQTVTTKQMHDKSTLGFWLAGGDICCPGYTSLDKIPEIVSACRKIASLIGSTTIYLMANTADGDQRIINELSRAIDIDPMPTMTRSTWMESIVMTMLLYGKGNAIVVPHTWQGYLQSLEPISADRVSFIADGYRDYKVAIDGKERRADSVLHFVYNPDKTYLWKGQGVSVSLRDLADNLRQAAHTEKAFMSSEFKPSIIVKVDAMTDEFSSPEGRQKLIESYINPQTPGAPWLIPAEQFDVQQVKPLTLSDLAIADTVTINKKSVAALLGVPAFVVGAGDYNRDEWNAFIQGTIMPICKSIAMEMTKKLILKPEWYLTFNVWSLIDYDLQTVSSVLLAGADRGYICGDEWRDRMHMSPAGLKEYKILENYIPYDMSGNQKKLVQNGE
jgi:HK97 family phage portal protein